MKALTIIIFFVVSGWLIMDAVAVTLTFFVENPIEFTKLSLYAGILVNFSCAANGYILFIISLVRLNID